MSPAPRAIGVDALLECERAMSTSSENAFAEDNSSMNLVHYGIGLSIYLNVIQGNDLSLRGWPHAARRSGRTRPRNEPTDRTAPLSKLMKCSGKPARLWPRSFLIGLFNHFGLLVGVEDGYITAPYPALTVT